MTLARRAGGISIARLVRDHQVLAERLQRNLAGKPAPRPASGARRLEFSARFVSAEDFGLGGDWFDVFLPDGQVGIVIGDVAGVGLRAAIVMVGCAAPCAYAIESTSPGQALAAWPASSRTSNRTRWRPSST